MVATSFRSPLDRMLIAKAAVAELLTAITLLAEAAARLHARSIQPWASPPLPGLRRLCEQERNIGYLYVGRLTTTAPIIN